MPSKTLVIVGFVFSSLAVGRGGMDSGGGDPYVMDFQRVGLILSKVLVSHPVPDLSTQRLVDDLLKETTKLVSQPTVQVNGLERCAKFQRSKGTITISRKCWKDLDVYFKAIIVCHEFRNIFGAHDYGDTAECGKLPRLAIQSAANPESRIHRRRLMGEAAVELMRYQTKASPFECHSHTFRNPTTDKMIQTATCEFEGDMTEAQPVFWWPYDQVGMAEVSVTGATANWLIQVPKLHSFPSGVDMSKRPKYIRCSANAWEQGRGTCTFTLTHPEKP